MIEIETAEGIMTMETLESAAKFIVDYSKVLHEAPRHNGIGSANHSEDL